MSDRDRLTGRRVLAGEPRMWCRAGDGPQSVGTRTLLWPEDVRSGGLIYPFEKARA